MVLSSFLICMSDKFTVPQITAVIAKPYVAAHGIAIFIK